MNMLFYIPLVFILLTTAALVFSQRRFAHGLTLFVEDDGDMKIVDGPFFSPEKSGEDAAEKAARDFLLQKENGNIQRARQLGCLFAKDVWESFSAPNSLADISQQEFHHRLLLQSYIVHRVISEYSPNSILAQTSMGVFYHAVEEYSQLLYQHVSDTAAFSLYILSERSGDSADEIGRIFARLIGQEDNPKAIASGNRLYRECYDHYVKEINDIAYVS